MTAPVALANKQIDSHLELAKWLAIVTMVIDHIGYLFADKVDYVAWRSMGRLCWPLIAWIVAMRLYVAPERTMGYLKRLLPWAIIAQVPYAVIFSIIKELPWYDAFNILFTIALGCMIFMLLQVVEKSGHARKLLAVAAICALTVIGVKVDYGAVGVIMIPVLALVARQSLASSAIACGLMGGLCNLFILLEQGMFTKFWMLALAPLPASLIALYCLHNLVRLPRLPRWFFYLFYPLHLVLLAALRVAMDSAYPP